MTKNGLVPLKSLELNFFIETTLSWSTANATNQVKLWTGHLDLHLIQVWNKYTYRKAQR